MNKLTLALVLSASTLVAATPVATSAAPPAASAGASASATTSGVVRGALGPAASSDPATAARAALARYADELGVDAAAFRFESVRTSDIGVHVRGREFRGGVPVAGTSAAVHVVDGEVWKVEARPSALPGTATSVAVDETVARTAALGALGITGADRVTSERLLVAHDGRLVDVHRVTVFDLATASVAEVDVTAAAGRVLAVRDPRRYEDGTASVFDPNPVVSLRDNTLREPGVDEAGVDTDLNDAKLTAALVALPIRDVSLPELAAGRLVGPWASVQGPAPLPPTVDFAFTRNDPRFEATMAYAHLDRIQRYFQDELGLTDVNAEPQDVYALPIAGFDNSFYLPAGDLMALGAGGVDDGEDAEVIVHEYGHAVQDAQVPGWGSTHEGGSMGEAFGDFLAAAYYGREISGGFQDACVADWDAVSYSSDDPPCLRRTDGDFRWPDDAQGQVHADGEVWLSYLWRLRDRLVTAEEVAADGLTDAEVARLKSDRSLLLVLTHHELLSPTAEFADAVAALRQAAVALGHPEWEAIVVEEAQRIGFAVS